jgi:hypothetical protein
MTEYDRAVHYIKFHCREHERECMKYFHQDIQWHKDNGVPYDLMNLAHKALYKYGH